MFALYDVVQDTLLRARLPDDDAPVTTDLTATRPTFDRNPEQAP